VCRKHNDEILIFLFSTFPSGRRGCKGRLKSPKNPPLSPFEKGGREGGF